MNRTAIHLGLYALAVAGLGLAPWTWTGAAVALGALGALVAFELFHKQIEYKDSRIEILIKGMDETTHLAKQSAAALLKHNGQIQRLERAMEIELTRSEAMGLEG